MKSPIFILSLPRSGSTLLQRILTKHDKIASVSEPWFMLPLIYSQKEDGVLSEFSHRNSQLGINDLIGELPNKQHDYDESLSLMANFIYKKLCKNNEDYFLDKTPRYHLIAKDLVRIFPDAKFIFLYRNPMDVFASTMTTWANNTFKKQYATRADLKNGFSNLKEAQISLGNNCLVVTYENLVSNTDIALSSICKYLNIENSYKADGELLQLSGRLGDQVGIKKYKKVNESSVGNWKKCFDTSFRKKVVKNYVNDLDKDLLKTIGYSKKEMLESIDQHKVKFRFSFRDRYHILFYKMAMYFNGHLLFTNVYRWARKKYLS